MAETVKRCKVGIVPVRITYHDERSEVFARRVVGYRFECSCGERGSSRALWATARADASEHTTRRDLAGNSGG